MSELWERINYIADISYLTNVFITEYDISKANINVLYSHGAISKDIYDWLYSSKKIVREKYIGMLQRSDESYTKILQSGIIDAKRRLFEANGILDREVLAIKNDAVFMINRELQYTKFNLIEFKRKETYTSFYKINNLEIYYFYNPIDKSENIEVKGISDNKIDLHRGYFLQILMDIFCITQMDGPIEAIKMIKDIYQLYIRKEFPIEVYRSFNGDSMYHFNVFSRLNTGYTSDNASDDMKFIIDGSINLNILREINKILYHMYFNQKNTL
jgi:hypothetical protein